MRGHYESKDERYTRIQHDQNCGIACPYCNASMGHFGFCPIFRNENPNENQSEVIHDGTQDEILGEAKKAIAYMESTPEFSEQDKIRLHGMGVKF